MFIEVTTIGQYGAAKGYKTLINTDKIVCIHEDSCKRAIIETTEGVRLVKESYDEVKSMLSMPLPLEEGILCRD